jgi:DNA-binding NtrC family response regulator
LYYRLAGVEVQVPPLRARRGDIPLLVRYFLDLSDHTRALEVSDVALEAMMTFDWPGNVRQLGRVLERAVALTSGPVIGLADLPAEISKEYREVIDALQGRDDSLRAWSSRYVRLVLERCGGNKRRACEVLDITYHTLRTLLEYDTGRPAREFVPHVTTLVESAPVGHG